MALPKVSFIEAKFGESIVSMAARHQNPSLPETYGLLYRVAFTERFNPGKVIKAISAALTTKGMEADFNIHDGELRLEIKRELLRWPGPYDGLRVLQRLLKPQIPRTGIAYETAGPQGRLDIQLSILGSFLSASEIGKVRQAIAAGGAQVTRIVRSDKLKAEVFFVSVPRRGGAGLQEFLQGLQQSCGVYVTMQDH